MPQNKQENRAVSRTIYINPHFKKPLAATLSNGAANIVNQKLISPGAHINPLFLSGSRPPAIHMNPDFLQSKLLIPPQLQHEQETRNSNKTDSDIKTSRIVLNPFHLSQKLSANKNGDVTLTKEIKQKIITKSHTKIVREPVAGRNVNAVASPSPPVLSFMPVSTAPLVRISSRKLVRRTLLPQAMASLNFSRSVTRASSINTVGKYKLDRRLYKPMNVNSKNKIGLGVKLKRKTFVARYALQRSNSVSKIIPSVSKRHSLSANKKLQMLNINGVLYKSTRNKLQRKDSNIVPKMSALNTQSNSNNKSNQKQTNISNGRVLFVHGTKFVLDKSGFKLTRMPTEIKNNTNAAQQNAGTPQRQRQRIDIGGLTYIASSTQNVFVRTRNHLTLAHLNTAKNRSLHLLTRRLVKSNIPCAIFQRIGKCKAHEVGKCNKLHDKQQVTICPRFLRSECHDTRCLLSHNVSLAKMPVCKFFLQGICVKTDCPYLHKKLGVNTDICPEFLRGYCKQEDRCNKRHEFVCPEYNRSGKCEMLNCMYCKKRTKKLLNKHPKIEQNKATESTTGEENSAQDAQEKSVEPLRYYIGKDTNSNTTSIAEVHDKNQEKDDANSQGVTYDSDSDMPSATVRPKLGALPAFIPLS